MWNNKSKRKKINNSDISLKNPIMENSNSVNLKDSTDKESEMIANDIVDSLIKKEEIDIKEISIENKKDEPLYLEDSVKWDDLGENKETGVKEDFKILNELDSSNKEINIKEKKEEEENKEEDWDVKDYKKLAELNQRWAQESEEKKEFIKDFSWGWFFVPLYLLIATRNWFFVFFFITMLFIPIANFITYILFSIFLWLSWNRLIYESAFYESLEQKIWLKKGFDSIWKFVWIVLLVFLVLLGILYLALGWIEIYVESV